jgi:hypothetical protein
MLEVDRTEIMFSAVSVFHDMRNEYRIMLI